jgi:iron complex outermembrane receptor protein
MKKSTGRRVRFWALGSAALLLTGSYAIEAYAQSAGIEEIVVTARKREENLQDAPISISAFSAESLQRRSLDQVSEIGRFSPNVQFNDSAPISGNNATSVVFIRGIGQNEFQLSADPGVGLYLDGVYIARAVGNLLDVLNVERIEVLRGPQGTLFGRNTIGGAVNVVSREPSDTLGGTMELVTGRFSRAEGRITLDVPLTSELRSSFAVFYRNRNGYVKGVGPNAPNLGDDNKFAGRAALLWTPSDRLKVNLSADGSVAREKSSPTVMIKANENAVAAQVWNGLYSGAPQICANPANAARLTDPRCYNNQWALAPFRSGGTFQSISRGFTDFLGEPYRSASDLDIYGASATIDYEVSDTLSLKSITAFRKVVGFWPRDSDHSPASVVQTKNTWNQEQFSQELQMLGTLFSDRVKWILGAYYGRDKGDHIDVVNVVDAYFNSGQTIRGRSPAVFGQATWNITDALSLTGGVRWTEDRKSFLPDQFVVNAGFLTGLVQNGTLLLPRTTKVIKDQAWTPMASLSYRWNPSLMTYASFSKGFKGGGFTQRVFPPLPAVPSFAPEFVKTYEIGFKADLLDNLVRVNGAAFHNKYTDLQITVNDPTLGFAPIIRNAGRAEINGGELELQARPVDELRLDVGIGYTDAKYTQVGIPGFGTAVTPASKLQNAPEWSFSAGISYDFALGNAGTLTPRLDWSYRSKVFNNAENTPEIVQPGFHLLNATVTFSDEDNLWTVRTGIKNLTNKKYIVSGYVDSFGGITEGNFGRPREWFFSVSRKF